MYGHEKRHQWFSQICEETMRYEYTVTKDSGEAEIMKAMGWKKLFKSLLMKYPKFSGWITYINKKGHTLLRFFRNGKTV